MRKDIKGYEGLYQITDDGQVISLERFTTFKNKGYRRKEEESIRKPQLTHKGYFKVQLRKEDKVKGFFIHRLVAQHFIPNPYNKPQVNHKDGDKLNNCVTNLEWVTNEENREHSNKHRLSQFHEVKPVEAFNDSETLTFQSINECAKHFNTYALKIKRATETKKAYFGYYFRLL